ncbi:MAG TPA: vitamin K epoxide reductase family protein [Candidatus Saccharimonadales bacterium]|nr:vitamin K epoxide reductase family protein [Candidatus Saccharimonadales bacterium]
MMIFKKNITLQKALPWLLVICGIIGLACALIIMYDKVELLKNPAFKPNCDLNPVISCGSVMESKQANAFGFPNPFIGIVGFSVVIATGMAILAGATKLKRWYWLGLQAGTIFGVAFIHWLFFQSVYRIGALCPYCMVVWVMTITLFWYVLLHNIQTGTIRLQGRLQQIGFFMRRHHLDILLVWFLVIAFFILKHFWYYYGQYIHL